jgi:hypothetical protein
MKKVLLAAAVALAPALYFTGTAMAQTVQYGTEICVNASQAAEAKRLFPNARIHVVPDFPDPEMNGWTIVSGRLRPDGSIHTDAEVIAHRRLDRSHRLAPGE